MSIAAEIDAREPRRRRRRRPLDAGALRSLAIVVLAATLLAFATLLTFGYLPRYQDDGRPILANADFREGFRDWQLEGLVTLDETELGLAILQNRDPGRAVYLRRTIALPPGRTHLRLAADIATSRVARGREPWQAARVYLVQQTREGDRLWNEPNRLTELIGTTSRQHYETVLEIPGTIAEAVLGIELAYATGRMEIANLKLEVVEERALFRLAATLLIAGWSLLGFWVTQRLYHSIRDRRVRSWLLVTLALVTGGVFMPSLVRQEIIDSLASGFGLRLADPDAFGHALAFALLALLVRSGRPRDPLLLHLACWLLVGAATEVLQLFTPDRDAQAGDWLMDALGSTGGLLVAEFGLGMRRRLAPAKPKRRRTSRGAARSPAP
jgi:hypothetical protein